jgi:hypothetical protein
MKTLLLLLAVLLPARVPAYAVNLTGLGASVHDAAGGGRTAFTSAETVTLRQQVSVAVTSAGQVVFTFKILSPAGAAVFAHTGNSAPGTAGGAQSQLAGISIPSFYTAPGLYTFKATAVLDAETVTQQATFMISSPNITLIYPPYGARGLADKPLTFRWSASGASRYRVTVADNAGLYNPAHTAVNGGESAYAYPDNPTQPREQLVPDQVYYWKVEGLDASNNRISESSVYNFSLKSQASAQSRNVMVSALDLSSPALDLEKPLNFKAVLFNTGSTTESNISLKLSLGGIPAQDSPKQIITIGPGEKKDVPFTAFMPSGQEEGLAVACADLFDDNIPDNCKTRLISKNAGSPAPPKTGKKLSYEEMFQEIIKRLGPDAAKALEGYTFENLTCTNCSQDELSAVISALISGEAQLVTASVLDTGAGETGTAGQAQASAAPEAEAAAAPVETNLEVQELKDETPGEWTGYTEPLKSREGVGLVIRDRKEWKKVWKSVSAAELPDVDFSAKMVVGVISGAKDRAESVRMLGKRKTDDGIAFDYYVIEAPAGEKPQLAAYIFKLYDSADEKAEFKRLDVKK